MRLHSVAAAYALWILGIFVSFYLANGRDESALQFALLCGVIPVACQICLLEGDWRGLIAPAKMWFALLMIILASYVVTGMDPKTAPIAAAVESEGAAVSPPWVPIVYTLNTAFIMAIATLVAGCADRRLLRLIAGFYSIFTAPFLLYIIVTGERVWGRLTAHLQPNIWGLLGLTICLAALARKFGVLTVTAFVIGVIGILEASSRESLVALVIAVLVIAPLQFQQMEPARRLVAAGALCITLGGAAILYDPYLLDAVDYLNHDVLLVDSPQRGLSSGFSGRTEVWGETFDLWLKSPLVGIGFRQHEHFLEGMPAHNAYLAMLADTGIVGLAWYLVLLVLSLVAAWRIEDQRTRRLILATLIAYIVDGFFDRRTINGGNPFGLLFLLCCAVALVDQSLRKATHYARSRGLLLMPR